MHSHKFQCHNYHSVEASLTSNVEALTEKIEKSDQLWVGDKLWRGEETTIKQCSLQKL